MGTNIHEAWHQDRTIAVRARLNLPGFDVWSRKSGIDHVEPPFAYIEEMVTLRAHLDQCGPGNAPLRVVCGSHRLGRIERTRIQAIVTQGATFD